MERLSSQASRIGVAGFFATAVAYGPARTGYGLLLPEMRDDFDLSGTLSGLIAGSQQVAYLVALLITTLFISRLGTRLMALLGASCAVVGMFVVAASSSTVSLAAGIAIAGMSAGFSWSSFNDAVRRHVTAEGQGFVLSLVSTGTSAGIAASGLLVVGLMGTDGSWRLAWVVFTVTAVGAALFCTLLVPRATSGTSTTSPPSYRNSLKARAVFGGSCKRNGTGSDVARVSVTDKAARLVGVAFVFGVVNAFYWTFAADLATAGIDSAIPIGALLYVFSGVAGLAGLSTGACESRFGLSLTLKGSLLSLSIGLGLLGLFNDWTSLTLLSATAYGVGVMFMSALLSIWSSRVFADRPSVGFSFILIVFGAGGAIGPPVLGFAADSFGLSASFIIASILTLALCLGIRLRTYDVS